MTALLDRLSLSVGWENDPERGLTSQKHAYIILTP